MDIVNPEMLELMSISLCVPYLSFLNVDYTRDKFGVDLSNIFNVSEHNGYEEKREIIEDKITIREIFEQTYSVSDIITDCKLRFESTRYFTRINDTKVCNKLFSIKKYFAQDSICYFITPKQINAPSANYFTATMFPGVMYAIGLNRSFAQHMRYYKFVVHSRTWLPYTGKKYSEVRRTNHPLNERYNIKYRRHYMEYLGYPYTDIICTNDKYADANCWEGCIMNRTISEFKRVAYDIEIETPYGYPPITKKQTRNQELSRKLDGIVSNCMKRCRERYCLFDYAYTSYDSDIHTDVAVYVKTPRAPDTLMSYLPTVRFLDLFVYIMGALGTWFGFAFIHVDRVIIPTDVGAKINEIKKNNFSPEIRAKNPELLFYHRHRTNRR